MITFANIVDRFETFVENHFFLKTFSFGSPEDLDLNKFENYPLLHLVYTSGNYVDKVKTYTLEVYIMDCPRGEQNRKEFERDVITQSELCAEDILADLENGGAIFDFDFAYILESASITPLEEENSNTLSGTLLTISIGVPYLYDSCNAPLVGVSPQGTSTTFSARGLLRVKEIDGTPDVTTVKTINVSNGTLTDDGNGVVTIDTSGTSPYPYTEVSKTFTRAELLAYKGLDVTAQPALQLITAEADKFHTIEEVYFIINKTGFNDSGSYDSNANIIVRQSTNQTANVTAAQIPKNRINQIMRNETSTQGLYFRDVPAGNESARLYSKNKGTHLFIGSTLNLTTNFLSLTIYIKYRAFSPS
tara:strand:- start:399 stop:1481 length:1083 start_codon:yes stop_codon:yes gene_type:complete